MHQRPFTNQHDAQYAKEPWDDDYQPHRSTPRVWYFFIVFVVSVILVGVFFVFFGFFCHYNPQGMLDAQAQANMSHTFQTVADVQTAAKLYWAMGGLYILAGAMVFAMPRNKLLWGYGIAIMVLAAFSGCMAPLSVALFIFWMLPATRAYFQR